MINLPRGLHLRDLQGSDKDFLIENIDELESEFQLAESLVMIDPYGAGVIKFKPCYYLDHCGSSLFIIDSNSIVYYVVEPREYQSISSLMESLIWHDLNSLDQEDVIKLITEGDKIFISAA